MEIIRDYEQGGPEWENARLGSIGGCSVDSVLAKGQGKTRKSLMYKLAGEILTGQKTESYMNPAMQRGHDFEDEARTLYEFTTDNKVEQVALIKSDIPGVHVSPDGLVGEDGGVEIKVRLPHVYIELVDTGKVETGYMRQCQHFLWVTGRQWVDFINYCPEIISKPMTIKRIARDEKIISQIESEIPVFIAELNEMVERFKA